MRAGAVAAATAVILSSGAAAQTTPQLSLHLDAVAMERAGGTVGVRCEVRWVNGGGPVAGDTCCAGEAFDGLSLVITDLRGREVARVSHVAHQSPFAPSNPFTLASGTTRRDLVFPVDGLVADTPVRAHLEGGVIGNPRLQSGFRTPARPVRVPPAAGASTTPDWEAMARAAHDHVDGLDRPRPRLAPIELPRPAACPRRRRAGVPVIHPARPGFPMPILRRVIRRDPRFATCASDCTPSTDLFELRLEPDGSVTHVTPRARIEGSDARTACLTAALEATRMPRMREAPIWIRVPLRLRPRPPPPRP